MHRRINYTHLSLVLVPIILPMISRVYCGSGSGSPDSHISTPKPSSMIPSPDDALEEEEEEDGCLEEGAVEDAVVDSVTEFWSC